MPSSDTAPPLSALQTTFVVPNLHCTSCLSHIEGVLGRLRPKIYSTSHSLAERTISVSHKPSLRVSTILKALADAGYDASQVLQDDSPIVLPTSRSLNGQVKATVPAAWLTRAIRSLGRGGLEAEANRKRKRHLENCERCQKHGYLDSPDTQALSVVDDEKVQHRPTVLQAPDEDASSDGTLAGTPPLEIQSTANPTKTFQATISIVGMTCSSCVGKVTETLEARPWTRAVNVNLLTNSATVSFEGKHNAKKLVEAVEDIGYDASLDEVVEVMNEKHASGTTSDLWRASFMVGGMTCSSCVGNVTRVLEECPWVKSVNVNLVTNSATVLFQGKQHLEDIQNTIEAVGYDAMLDDVVNLKPDPIASVQRTIAVHVEGLYCENCPSRIEDALNSLGEPVSVDKPPRLDDAILKITYTPRSPEFTVRHILDSLSAADPAFKPSIFHPPTPEERARLMQARERRRIRFRTLLTVTVAIPTFIIGIVLMTLVPSSNTTRRYLMHPLGGVSRAQWGLLILATPVYFFAADVFHRRAIKEIYALWRRSSPTPILRRLYRFGSMNLLISIGTTIAYLSSFAELIIAATRSSEPTSDNSTSDNHSFYFDSVVFLTMFLLFGQLIRAYSEAKTGDAVAMLGKLRPTEAILVNSDNDGSAYQQSTVNVDLLEIGDVVAVPHGSSPPCDGIILHGQASKFDESSLTGESKLVSKAIGDEVYSGTVNMGAPVSIRVSKISGSSMLDQIIKVVREGQGRRAPVERLADTLTGYFVPAITLLAIGTWFTWLGLGLYGALPASWLDVQNGGWPFWSLQFAIAVFVIACPCGIGLAAPTALFVGGGLAASHGILVKGGGEAFQESSNLDCVVFDKTGTLSKGGAPAITDFETIPPADDATADDELTRGLLKALEGSSSHPIAGAIVSFCESRGSQDIKAQNIEEIPGKGMKGSFVSIDGSQRLLEVIAGNESLMSDHRVPLPPSVVDTLTSWKVQGKSIVLVASKATDASEPSSASWALREIFAVSDPLRPESAAVVNALQRRGIDVWMISGDNPMTAYAVGDMVGIPRDNIIAGVLPEQKAEKIKYLQKSQKKSYSRSCFGRKYEHTQQRATVAMVGDGVNDSPALTVADVGIAIGSGSDVAISSAEFVLISPSLTSLLTLIDLSRTVFRRIKFNFAWALVYNLVALPVAAGVLYPVVSNGNHVRLDPVWASLAMALSSVSVVCSSLLLRSRLPYVGFRPDRSVILTD